MTPFRIAAALTSAVLLSACVAPDAAQLVPTGTTLSASVTEKAEAPAVRYRLAGLRVAIPDTLRVSEADRFYPIADIVWRGDPIGDRRAQIRSIFADSAAKAQAGPARGVPAVADIQITRFHALTEKARYTVGGVHSIKFILTLRDPKSNAVLDGPRPVVADVKASGGTRAVAEDAAGRTQRVVIVEDLARVLRRELGEPLPTQVVTYGLSSGEVVFTPVDITPG